MNCRRFYYFGRYVAASLSSVVRTAVAETPATLSNSEVFRDLGSLCGRKLGEISEVTEDLGDRIFGLTQTDLRGRRRPRRSLFIFPLCQSASQLSKWPRCIMTARPPASLTKPFACGTSATSRHIWPATASAMAAAR